jgi:hypothetical protein
MRQYLGVFERIGGALLIVSSIYLRYEAIATWIALHAASTNSIRGAKM